MRAALIPAAFALIAFARTAHATPGEDLKDARAAFRAGQYGRALPLYNGLLYPQERLASPEDLTEAYVALGVCRFEDGDQVGARREFEKALALDPNHQLDPLMVTDKAAIRLWDDTKTDIKSRAERERAAQALADARKRLESLVYFESHSYAYNFVPFGFGQLQNGQRWKAVGFASGELATLGTSMGIWLYLVDRYGLSNQHLHIDNGEVQTIRTLQQIEIAAGASFLVLYIAGVYDGVAHFKPQKRLAPDPSLLKGIEPTPKPAATSLRDSIYITPLIVPAGAGIGLTWEH